MVKCGHMDISYKVWTSPTARQFARTLVQIKDVKTMETFLRDVMTEKEIIEISSRLEAARMLQNGARYTEVIAKTNLSSRTIARISTWLQNGKGGYKAALNHHRPSKPRLGAA